MTREKEILNEVYYQNQLADIDGESFIRGAEWADKNPKSPWISVKDDLPCNHKKLTHKDYTVEVLALDDCNSYRVVRMWEFGGKWIWGLDDLPITHWMTLPELPKE